MQDTLEALYHGGVYPAEQFLPRQDEYTDLQEQMHERFQSLLKKLDVSLKKELNLLIDEQLDAFSMENRAMFIGGYRLGARLTVEALMTEGENHRKDAE